MSVAPGVLAFARIGIVSLDAAGTNTAPSSAAAAPVLAVPLRSQRRRRRYTAAAEIQGIYQSGRHCAADLIAGGRLQQGISRGSPEQVIDGWRYFGYRPAEGESDADMGRRHAAVFLDVLRGTGFAEPSPRPMFQNPPGLLRIEPHSEGLRDRIWWGSGSDATAVWAAGAG